MTRYYYQVEGEVRNNIGDVLQGMVAKAFLPPGSAAVDRERLASIDRSEPGYLVANGWYLHSLEEFPPPPNISPLYVSVHVANSDLLKSKTVREHFAANAPIGCRDRKTLKLFSGWGIPAYYSGCLTVTTKARADIGTSGELLLVDNIDHPIPDTVRLKLEEMLGERLTRVSHDPPDISGALHEYDRKVTEHMDALLARYCRARLVVTTKIHCALPSLGMGANVMVIHPDPKDPRLETVREFVEVTSFDEIMKMSELVVPEIDRRALRSRASFLSELVNEGVRDGTNPVATSPQYRVTRRVARSRALLYRSLVRLMLALRLDRPQLRRVYGAETRSVPVSS